MGTEGEGISLDLGIGSSVDPLHLSEVDFYTGQPGKDTPDSDLKNRCYQGQERCMWIGKPLILQQTSGCGG